MKECRARPVSVFVAACVAATCAAIVAASGTGRPASAGSGLELKPEVLAVVEHRLANGLQVLMVEDHSVPSISYFTFFSVGARDEREGITGMSHLFEHMMFNGARKYGPKEFDRFLERAGGVSNAYTTRDYTAYYQTFPSEALALVMDLEADRLSGLDVRDEMLESERDVVLEERYFRIDDNPEGSLDERLWGTAFVEHPYRWPILGWAPDIESVTRRDCMKFYARHYAPNRATVVAVGDFRTADLVHLAERTYGSIPPRSDERPAIAPEPVQFKERRFTYRRASEIPILSIAYKSPPAANPDTFVLDGIQYALGEGRSSRLHRRLVYREELANWVYVDFPWHVDAALFTIGVGIKPDVDPSLVEGIVHEEVERLIAEGVSGDELTKVRNKLELAVLRDLSTDSSRAEAIGTYEVLMGDWRAIHEALAAYRVLTPAAIKRVAAEYLLKERRTVALLKPKRPRGGGR